MYIVIAGGGKIGEYLASVLLSSGNDVAVIEENLPRPTACRWRFKGATWSSTATAATRSTRRMPASQGRRVRGHHGPGRRQPGVVRDRPARVQRAALYRARNNPKNLRIFREVGIESVSSTTLIANLIEEETLLGSVSVASSLTHGNVRLTEIVVPRMRHHPTRPASWCRRFPCPRTA